MENSSFNSHELCMLGCQLIEMLRPVEWVQSPQDASTIHHDMIAGEFGRTGEILGCMPS
jgi:hypothetical protein